MYERPLRSKHAQLPLKMTLSHTIKNQRKKIIIKKDLGRDKTYQTLGGIKDKGTGL